MNERLRTVPSLAHLLPVTSEADFHTAGWIHAYRSLALSCGRPTHVWFYEHLVQDPADFDGLIASLKGRQRPHQGRRAISRNVGRPATNDVEAHLAAWQDSLSQPTVARILSLCDAAGLRFYDHSPYPVAEFEVRDDNA